MKAWEKTQKEWIWEEEDRKAWWWEYSGVVVSDKMVAEEALERAVKRVTRNKLAEKAAEEAVEWLQIRQIQVSSDFLRTFSEFGEVGEDSGTAACALERQRTRGEFHISEF